MSVAPAIYPRSEHTLGPNVKSRNNHNKFTRLPSYHIGSPLHILASQYSTTSIRALLRAPSHHNIIAASESFFGSNSFFHSRVVSRYEIINIESRIAGLAIWRKDISSFGE